MSITGAAYNLASSNTIAPINFGVLHVGDPTATRALSIMNTAPAGAFSEGLDSSFGSYTNNGGTLTPGFAGSITNLRGGIDEFDEHDGFARYRCGRVGQRQHHGPSGVERHDQRVAEYCAARPDAAVTGSVITGTITNLAVPQIKNCADHLCRANRRCGWNQGCQHHQRRAGQPVYRRADRQRDRHHRHRHHRRGRLWAAHRQSGARRPADQCHLYPSRYRCIDRRRQSGQRR